MFKVCKTDANQKLIKLKKNRLYAGSWVNVINPSSEELEKISKEWTVAEATEKGTKKLEEEIETEIEYKQNILRKKCKCS